MLTIFKVQQYLNFEWKFGLSTFSFVVHIMNFLQVATEINIIYGAFCVETSNSSLSVNRKKKWIRGYPLTSLIVTYRSAPITNQTCARTTHALCMPTWGDIPAHAPACLILITAARVNTRRPRFTLASSSSRWRMVHDCIMSLYVLCVGISV